MPIYGDMLNFFPELLSTYEVFSMSAKIGSGYGTRKNKRSVQGYLSRWKPGSLGVQGDLRTANDQLALWVCDVDVGTARIKQGEYLEYEGQVYVISHDDNAAAEGGFTQYDLQLEASVTDKQVWNQDVDKNIRTDYE